MKQFDVYRNPSARTNRFWPYYLILQHDYFDVLTTRVIVPLVAEEELSLSQKRLTPLLAVDDRNYFLFTPAITFLDSKKINKKDFICNVAAVRSDILSAIDTLITNA